MNGAQLPTGVDSAAFEVNKNQMVVIHLLFEKVCLIFLPMVSKRETILVFIRIYYFELKNSFQPLEMLLAATLKANDSNFWLLTTTTAYSKNIVASPQLR